jgi:hypothetical protein
LLLHLRARAGRDAAGVRGWRVAGVIEETEIQLGELLAKSDVVITGVPQKTVRLVARRPPP